jgi:hypothetical protein
MGQVRDLWDRVSLAKAFWVVAKYLLFLCTAVAVAQLPA